MLVTGGDYNAYNAGYCCCYLNTDDKQPQVVFLQDCKLTGGLILTKSHYRANVVIALCPQPYRVFGQFKEVFILFYKAS